MQTILVAFDFEFDIVWRFLFDDTILRGARTTIYVALAAQGIGIGLGVLLAVLRNSGNPVLAGLTNAYIWLFRGTPVLIQLLILHNGLPRFVNEPAFTEFLTPFRSAMITFGLNEAAYMSEIARAGIQSVEAGQVDAAKSLGMTYYKAMRRIILPQALRVMIPPTGNEFIAMLKNTSIAITIALTELNTAARNIYSSPTSPAAFDVLELLVVASLWYLAMTTVFSLGQAELEARLAVSERERRLPLSSRMLALMGGRRGL